MTQTPIVAWFWPNPAMKVWVPASEKCRVQVGSNPQDTIFLSGITTDALVGAVKTALSAC